MMDINTRQFLLVLAGIFLLSACSDNRSSALTQQPQAMIIECQSDCSALIAQVTAAGATVSQRYRNVNAFAATLTRSQAQSLQKSGKLLRAVRDVTIRPPRPRGLAKLSANGNQRLSALPLTSLNQPGTKRPANYLFNTSNTQTAQLHEAGLFGEGSIVAIIDTGILNNTDLAPQLTDNVIGGENLVDLEDEPSATSRQNDSHGTMVAAMVAGHGALAVASDGKLAKAVNAYAPDSILNLEENVSVVPLLGQAPAASLYALKVFSVTEEDTPTSIVLAAMDRVITLKENYLRGDSSAPVAGDGSEDNPFVYDALDIDVVNLSLGGPSLFPGFDADDQLVMAMLALDITVVTSAGNEGPASLTVGSPAASTASIAVGAADSPIHERIAIDIIKGEGIGALQRPTDGHQTAYFSSRGPIADGRVGVDLVANGSNVLVPGIDGIYIVDGTSFSGPTVAGAAALLRAALPEAQATQVRRALIDNANPDMINPGAAAIDQGHGYLDVAKSYQALQAQEIDAELPPMPRLGRREPAKVSDNIEDFALIKLSEHRSYSVTVRPGEARQFYVKSDAEIGQLEITVSDIVPALPAEEQNALFGDDLILTVLDAPVGDYQPFFDRIIAEETTVSADNPQAGLVRIAVTGDWTNAGEVSATVTVRKREQELPRAVLKERIADLQFTEFTFEVKEGTSALDFLLEWKYDHGYYPSLDLDLLLLDPEENLYVDAATLNSPERLTIDNPAPGTWRGIVDGYQLYGYRDRYQLHISDQDGKAVRVRLP